MQLLKVSFLLTLRYLLTVLLEHAQLQTLVQLGLLDLPELEELLLAGVELVEQLHDAGDGGLQVGVERHVAGRAVPPAVPAVVTLPTLATWKPEDENFYQFSSFNFSQYQIDCSIYPSI